MALECKLKSRGTCILSDLWCHISHHRTLQATIPQGLRRSPASFKQLPCFLADITVYVNLVSRAVSKSEGIYCSKEMKDWKRPKILTQREPIKDILPCQRLSICQFCKKKHLKTEIYKKTEGQVRRC